MGIWRHILILNTQISALNLFHSILDAHTWLLLSNFKWPFARCIRDFQGLLLTYFHLLILVLNWYSLLSLEIIFDFYLDFVLLLRVFRVINDHIVNAARPIQGWNDQTYIVAFTLNPDLFTGILFLKIFPKLIHINQGEHNFNWLSQIALSAQFLMPLEFNITQVEQNIIHVLQ